MTSPNRNQYGLTDRDMKTIEHILKKYPDIEEVRLFGSRANGNYNPGSDIDFAVMNQGVSFTTIARLAADFADSSLPYTVDVVSLEQVTHPELVDRIKRGLIFWRN